MKYFKLALNLTLIVLTCYAGFTVGNAGIINPVDWSADSQKYFTIVLIGCIITYMVFSAELPKFK